MRLSRLFVLISLIFFSLVSVFAVTEFEESYALLIRADQYTPYNLPDYTLMPNMTPACHKESRYAVRYWRVEDDQTKIFVKFFNGDDFFTSSAFDQGFVVSDLFIGEEGVLFPVNDRLSTEGVFLLSSFGEQRRVVDPNSYENLKAISRPAFFKNKILFRGLHGDGLRKIYLGEDVLLKEEGSGIAYLFLPSVKNNEMVLKVNYGSPGEVSRANPDEILFYKNNKFISIAKDQDLDPASDFLSFDNSPVLDGEGGVVFVADSKKHGRSLWYFKNKSLSLIYSPSFELGDLEYFRPSVGGGKVVFRLIQNQRRGLYTWSKEKGLSLTLSQGSNLITNEGTLRVIDREKWPAFSGAPCVSSTGNLYIHAVLEDLRGEENKGSGVFKFK